MNFSILIFTCVVVLQITRGWAGGGFLVGFWQCTQRNGAACLAWFPNPVYCNVFGFKISCNNSCLPDLTSCCGCVPRCFPSASKVNLKNGKSIPMSDLQLGDQVQTGISSLFSYNFGSRLVKNYKMFV